MRWRGRNIPAPQLLEPEGMMGALAAAIENNGWVLAVRGAWDATPGAWNFNAQDRVNGQYLSEGVDQFPLDPSGTPKISLTLLSAGFDRTPEAASKATANPARARRIVATKVLRRTHPDHAQVDETDHGDGTRTVRFALSDRVFSSCVVSNMTLLDGWKLGQIGGLLPCVNGSGRTLPVPITRWAIPPYMLVRGTTEAPAHLFDVELLIASHFPEHFGSELHQAVAAVHVMATDGVTAKYFWITSPSSSARPDALRCWRGTADLSGLNPGVISFHYEVFPWIGEARASGAMTAAGHSTLRDAGFSNLWGAPLTVCYDPVGARYNVRYFHIDPAAANKTSGSSVNVVPHASLAAARAAPLASKAANIAVATKYMRDTPYNLPAANGLNQLGTKSADFCVMVLAPGVHGYSSEVVSTTAAVYAQEGWMIIQGDPDDNDPRVNCILRSGTAAGGSGNVSRLWLRDLTLEMGQVAMLPGSGQVLGERVTVRGKAGFETATNSYYVTSTTSYWLDTDASSYGNQASGILLRGGSRTRGVGAAVAIGITIGIESGVARNTVHAFALSGGGDNMIWNCAVLAWDAAFVGVSGTSAEPGGTNQFGSPLILRRLAVVNTLVEGVNTALLQLGEGTYNTMRDSIWDGNTIVGQRMNFHNGPPQPFTNSGATVTAGLKSHGLSVGDSVTIAGCSPAGYNGTFTVSAVLDAHRFQYVAGTSPGGMTARGTVMKPSGAVQAIVRDGVQNTGNVLRNSLIDDNGTKHDLFSLDGSLTQSWEMLYGVGYRSNALGNRDTTGAQDFQYAHFGVSSIVSTSYDGFGSNWFGFVRDDTDNGGGSNAGDGDYHPSVALGSRVAGQAELAIIDRSADNRIRGARYSIGAFTAVPDEPLSSVEVATGRHAHRASSVTLERGSVLSPREGRLIVRDSEVVVRALQAPDRGDVPFRRLWVDADDRRISPVAD